MAVSETESELGNGDPGANENDHNDERPDLMPLGRIGESLLNRVAMNRTGNENRATGRADQGSQELRESLRRQRDEHEQGDRPGDHATAGESEVIAQRHERDCGCRGGSGAERAG